MECLSIVREAVCINKPQIVEFLGENTTSEKKADGLAERF